MGITEDTQYWDPDSKLRPMFFVPGPQWVQYTDKEMQMYENVSHLEMSAVEIQTAGDVPGLEAQVRRALTQINPNLTMIEFRDVPSRCRISFSRRR